MCYNYYPLCSQITNSVGYSFFKSENSLYEYENTEKKNICWIRNSRSVSIDRNSRRGKARLRDIQLLREVRFLLNVSRTPAANRYLTRSRHIAVNGWPLLPGRHFKITLKSSYINDHDQSIPYEDKNLFESKDLNFFIIQLNQRSSPFVGCF